MPKGAYLTPRIKELLAKIYLDSHRQIGPTKAHEKLLKKMRDEGLDKTFGPNYPSVSSVSKLLTKYSKTYEEQPPELKELDKPWSTMSLVKYPIPPEALPSVLQVWVWVRENLDTKFSIRQAQWVARLYAVTKDISLLALLSRMNSLLELVGKIAGISTEDWRIHNVDLDIFKEMTGQEITPERGRKILGLSEEEWLAEKELDKFFEAHEAEFEKKLMHHLYEKYVKPSEKKGGRQ